LLEGGANLRIVKTDNGEMIINGIRLSPKQSEIVKYDGNIVVSASAGTGKTRTMVSKIVYDLERNKTHKVIAAITFTIKATEEIRERLVLNVALNFIGTNNTFAIEEIIKPFMKDVYGDEYNIDFDTDYTNKDYKFDNFDDGITLMKDNETIYSYCTLRNCKRHNRDCSAQKKNFVFELALDIVKRSKACRLFLKAKYFSIYIDEYQDCDNEMHNFFMYLCSELGISTFIVGDSKQSIYRWRGAKPELFTDVVNNSTFKHFILTENHRSSINIQNYSNLLFANTSGLYKKSKNEGDILVVKNTINWATIVVDLIDKEKSTGLLRAANEFTKNQKGGAKDGAELLKQSGINFVYIPEAPIEQITTSSAWLYMAMARYIMLDGYSVYHFVEEVPVEGAIDKKAINTVKKYLTQVKNNRTDEPKFTEAFKLLSIFFNCGAVDESHVAKLFETISDSQYVASISEDLPTHSAMTLYKSKGLEFDQTIIFFEDYAHSKKVNPEHINNHYVACTRAKSKLIIVSTGHEDSKAFIAELKKLMSDVNFGDLLTKVP